MQFTRAIPFQEAIDKLGERSVIGSRLGGRQPARSEAHPQADAASRREARANANPGHRGDDVIARVEA